MSALFAAVTSLLIGLALSAETFWGRCPSAPSNIPDFDMEKFEGVWYLHETFDPGEKCITWTITKGSEPNTWNVVEDKESGAAHSIGIKPSDIYTGTITMKNSKKPNQLRIFWPVSAIAGDAALTIYDTDYDNYAGLFECQNVGFFHRQSGIIMSRHPAMEVEHRQNSRIQTSDIKPEYYQRVRQGNCGYKYKETEIETDSTGESGFGGMGNDGVYYADDTS